MIEIPAEPADPEKLPPLLKGFKAVPPLAITTDLNHLRATIERLIRLARVSRTSHNAAEMNRARLLRVGRVRDVVLNELPGPPARNIKEAVVERQVDISSIMSKSSYMVIEHYKNPRL